MSFYLKNSKSPIVKIFENDSSITTNLKFTTEAKLLVKKLFELREEFFFTRLRNDPRRVMILTRSE